MIEKPKSARITNLVTKNHLSISKSEGKKMRFLMVWHMLIDSLIKQLNDIFERVMNITPTNIKED